MGVYGDLVILWGSCYTIPKAVFYLLLKGDENPNVEPPKYYGPYDGDPQKGTPQVWESPISLNTPET